MLSAKRASPEQFEEAQAELRGQMEAQAPEVRNVSEAAALGRARVFVFRGKRFRVPPVSYEDGLKLLDIAIRSDALAKRAISPDTVDEFRAVVRDAVEVLGRLARPWYLRWLPNPFRGATLDEVHAACFFFGRSRIGLPSGSRSATGASLHPSTT